MKKEKVIYIIRLKKTFNNLLDVNNYFSSLYNKELEVSYYKEDPKLKKWIPIFFKRLIYKYLFV